MLPHASLEIGAQSSNVKSGEENAAGRETVRSGEPYHRNGQMSQGARLMYIVLPSFAHRKRDTM